MNPYLVLETIGIHDQQIIFWGCIMIISLIATAICTLGDFKKWNTRVHLFLTMAFTVLFLASLGIFLSHIWDPNLLAKDYYIYAISDDNFVRQEIPDDKLFSIKDAKHIKIVEREWVFCIDNSTFIRNEPNQSQNILRDHGVNKISARVVFTTEASEKIVTDSITIEDQKEMARASFMLAVITSCARLNSTKEPIYESFESNFRTILNNTLAYTKSAKIIIGITANTRE